MHSLKKGGEKQKARKHGERRSRALQPTMVRKWATSTGASSLTAIIIIIKIIIIVKIKIMNKSKKWLNRLTINIFGEIIMNTLISIHGLLIMSWTEWRVMVGECDSNRLKVKSQKKAKEIDGEEKATSIIISVRLMHDSATHQTGVTEGKRERECVSRKEQKSEGGDKREERRIMNSTYPFCDSNWQS